MKKLNQKLKNLDEFKVHMNDVFIIFNNFTQGKEIKVSNLVLLTVDAKQKNDSLKWRVKPNLIDFETLNCEKIELNNRSIALADTLKLCRLFDIKNSNQISCYSLHKMYENCDKEKLYEQWTKSEIECDTLCK